MRTRIDKWFCLGLALAGCRSASAQVVYGGEGHWWWEASTDGGVSYSAGLVEVPQTQGSVLVRGRFEFPAGQRHYFGLAGLDAAVFNAAPGDSITNATGGEAMISGVVHRLPGILKIDAIDDTLPPGQGPGWTGLRQDPPWTLPVPSYSNPITLVEYSLTLDPTPGNRLIGGIFVYFDVDGHSTAATIYSTYFTDRDTVYRVSFTQDPLTVRVVPAPGVMALAGAGVALASRRRGAAHCAPANASPPGSALPQYRPGERGPVRQYLMNAVDPMPLFQGNCVTGGRLNAARALGATCN